MRGKNSKKSVTQPQKQDRAKHRCPDAVTELISLINSIPPDRKLPYSYDLAREYSGTAKLRELLQGVPKSFLDQYADIQQAYEDFRRRRRAIHELAQYAAQPADKRDVYKATVFYRDRKTRQWWRAHRAVAGGIGYTDVARGDGPPEWWLEDISENDKDALLGPERWPAASLVIDQQGRFAVREEWVTALIGVEADRIRECEICQQVFWARQDNMWACSPRCSNARRQRKLRENRSQYEGARKKKRRKPKVATGRK